MLGVATVTAALLIGLRLGDGWRDSVDLALGALFAYFLALICAALQAHWAFDGPDEEQQRLPTLALPWAVAALLLVLLTR